MVACSPRTRVLASLLLLVVCFFPLLWIAQYNFPTGDDYLTFFQARTLGPLRATRWWYFNWTGRYTAFFLQSLYPEYDAWLAAYRRIPVALLVFGFASLWYFLRAFLGREIPRADSFTLAAAMYVFLIGLTPDIATAFYWLISSLLFMGAFFVTLLILGLYIDLETAARRSTRVVLSTVVIMLIVFLCGLNEVSLLLFLAIFALINCHQLVHSRKFSARGVTFLAFGIVFGLVALWAPGNAVRAGQLRIKTQMLGTLPDGLTTTLGLLLKLLVTTPLLLASGLYYAFLQANRDRLAGLRSLLSGVRWYWVLVFIVCIVTVVNVVVFGKIGVGGVPQRVQNLYVFSMVLGWFFFVTVLFINVSAAYGEVRTSKWLLAAFTAAVGVFLVTGFAVQVGVGNADPSGNRLRDAVSRIHTNSVYANAYLDLLSGRASRYDAQNGETARRVKAADGECVEIPPPAAMPTTIALDWVKYPWRWCAREYLREQYGSASP